MTDRRQNAFKYRVEAAETAKSRPHPTHLANGDEQRYASDRYAMSFTKGLEHDHKDGLIKDRAHFEAFRRCVDEGYIDPFTAGVPVPTHAEADRRKWEAPTAGLAFELEGPDPQAVTMAPAPELCSDELTFEMAEVYELALLRDVPFTEFSDCGGKKTPVDQASRRLNQLDYAQSGFPGRPRITNEAGKLRDQNVFRGSSPGVEVGPYLSQFMLIGNKARCEATKPIDGKITYGAITIDQKISEATEKLDYMQSKKDWVFIQNGFAPGDSPKGKPFTGKRRFISTPRDLATYVHFDALYEAYLNACLILLDMGAPFDPSFDALSGGGNLQSNTPWGGTSQPRSTGGFALYGGPHVLTLVTEVATRALKAVRFQKFNNHIRLRPEALAGRIACKKEIKECHPDLAHKLHVVANDMGPIVGKIEALNKACGGDKAAFLPMAFPEGSPMHPAYGAGHATVAGACVTMLKAFFDTDAVLAQTADGDVTFKRREKTDTPVAYTSDYKVGTGKGHKLVEACDGDFLTLEGELNKLAANISIGRNMAGVHYFTDYYDSLRMGEEIALGILEEQSHGYPTDPFVVSVPTFDGDVRRIGRL